MVGYAILYYALSLPRQTLNVSVMRMHLHLTLVALGAAYVCANAVESTMNRLVAETLTLLSSHRILLIGDGVIFFLIPTAFKIYR